MTTSLPGAALEAALGAGRTTLGEAEALDLLDAYGVPTPVRQRLAPGDPLEDLRPAPPWALKAISEQLLHKSDAGGVRLGLEHVEAIAAAQRETADLPGLDGWLLEEMAAPGVELLVGGMRHARFGPMILVGLGGVFVEYLQDVALRICPIDEADARAMLDSLRARALLEGARGREPVDREAIVDALVRIGGRDGLLMSHAGEIAELDVNPLIASPSGVVAVDARVVLERAAPEPARAAAPDLGALLEPNAVAVVGASTGGKAFGNQYIRHLRSYGFDGPIYPVHPSAPEVDGLTAYPSLAALPETVDYAFVSVSADRCPPLLAEAGGRVRIAQVMASGFGEGSGDRTREAELLEAAGRGGMRLLGPNCVGTHSPSGKLTYIGGPDPTPGHVAVISQSGGLSMDAIRRGARRGVRFRAVISAGNSADLGPAELVAWFLRDPGTRVIGLYLEDARRGRQLFDALREAGGAKPVVLLVGGRTAQGARAALSHTGALAQDARAWEALAAQTGMVLTDSLDEFLDVLLAVQLVELDRARPTRNVVLFGNGGGASVLAADALSRAGLALPPLPAGTQAELLGLDLPDGASVTNPVDIPANVMQRQQGAVARQILETLFTQARPEALVLHLNVPVILGYTHVDILGVVIEASLALRRTGAGDGCHVLLVLRSDGEPEIEARKRELRERALEAGIPVYDEVDSAARALGGLARAEAGLS